MYLLNGKTPAKLEAISFSDLQWKELEGKYAESYN